MLGNIEPVNIWIIDFFHETHDSAEGSHLTWRRIFKFMSRCGPGHSCKGIFENEFAVWRAEEARPRSEHTGSSLPKMLRGKSPCLGAESATGRPQGPNPGTDSDATCGVVVLGLWPFATAKLCREHLQKMPTERGSLSSCSPFAIFFHGFKQVELSHKIACFRV